MQVSPQHIVVADPKKEEGIILRQAIIAARIKAAIEVFEDGKPLLEYLNNTKNPMPEVIFLDINTPPPDGRQALEFIRLNPRFDNVPVIIFTESGMAINIQESRLMGANLYMFKPASFDRLVEMLQKLFTNNWKEDLLQTKDENFVLKY